MWQNVTRNLRATFKRTQLTLTWEWMELDGNGEVHVIFGYRLLRSTLRTSRLNLIGSSRFFTSLGL